MKFYDTTRNMPFPYQRVKFHALLLKNAAQEECKKTPLDSFKTPFPAGAGAGRCIRAGQQLKYVHVLW